MQQSGRQWYQYPVVRLFLGIFVVGLVLSLVVSGIFLIRRLQGEREGIGRIVDVRETEIMVMNRRNEPTRVLLDGDTAILYLDSAQEQLEPGQMVMVSGTRVEQGVMQARYIRVLPPPR